MSAMYAMEYAIDVVEYAIDVVESEMSEKGRDLHWLDGLLLHPLDWLEITICSLFEDKEKYKNMYANHWYHNYMSRHPTMQ